MNQWEEFENACKAHDWYYPMSDDHRVYSEGNAAHQKLRSMAQALAYIDDARTCEIWNRYSPRNLYVVIDSWMPKPLPLTKLFLELIALNATLEDEIAHPDKNPYWHAQYMRSLTRQRRRVLEEIERINEFNERIFRASKVCA